MSFRNWTAAARGPSVYHAWSGDRPGQYLSFETQSFPFSLVQSSIYIQINKPVLLRLCCLMW